MDNAPAQRVRQTAVLFRGKNPEFSAPAAPNGPDFYPVDYRIWGVMQEEVYHTPSLVHAQGGHFEQLL